MTTPSRTRRYLLQKVAPQVPKVPTAQLFGQWTLLSRGYCHLCDEMLDAARAFGLEPTVLDVDEDDALVAKWDEDVPVLLFDGAPVCIHRFSAAAVQAVLG